MSSSVIKLLALLTSLLILFFGCIAQVNILSVQNQEIKALSRDVAKLENQKESLAQENTTRLTQEIDKLVTQGKIQPVTIGETARQVPLSETIKQQQRTLEKPSLNPNMVVTR
jgi:hypothetical protein